MQWKLILIWNRRHKSDLFAYILIASIIDNTTITIYSLSDGFYAKKRYYNISHMCYYIKYYNKYIQSSINDSLNDAFIIIARRKRRRSPNKSLLATMMLRVRILWASCHLRNLRYYHRKWMNLHFLWVF